MPHSHDLAPNSDVSPWLETLRLMASEMGPKRPFQTSLTSLLRKLQSLPRSRQSLRLFRQRPKAWRSCTATPSHFRSGSR